MGEQPKRLSSRVVIRWAILYFWLVILEEADFAGLLLFKC